uniref:NTR domain-containing protein n=1 Tax=Steinernema glaseri TaxID=37863 RepID=A0A1I8AD51_9BILA
MTIYFLTLVLLSLLDASSGCSCSDASNKEIFCNAHWVGLLKIISKSLSEDNQTLEYRVGIVKMFKSSNFSLTNGVRIPLETSASAGTCGLDFLKTKTVYLLLGKVDGRVLKTSLCGQLHLDEWKSVPKQIKHELKTRAYEPCDGSGKKVVASVP